MTAVEWAKKKPPQNGPKPSCIAGKEARHDRNNDNTSSNEILFEEKVFFCEGDVDGAKHDKSDPRFASGVVPLPLAVQHCWPTLFPTISSSKKSIRKGVFWVSSSSSNSDGSVRTMGNDRDAWCNTSLQSSRSPFRKGKCDTQIHQFDCIRRKVTRTKEQHFRKRGTSTKDLIRRSIGGKLRIAFIDKYLAVVVKPYGMPVHKVVDSPIAARPAANIIGTNGVADINDHSRSGNCGTDADKEKDRCDNDIAAKTGEKIVSMHELLLHCLPQLPMEVATSKNENRLDNDPLRRPAAVHRLDQPTYGLLIVARTRPAARFLSHAFENRSEFLVKRYRAIVHGHLEGGDEHRDSNAAGFVRSPLSGKECCSEYRVVRRFEVDPAAENSSPRDSNYENDDHKKKASTAPRVPLTLVDLFPHTGRKHQLRRHMASIGHPIAGDTKYGNQSDDDARLLLHVPTMLPQHNGGASSLDTSRTRTSDNFQRPRDGPALPLMLAAVEIIFPHPASTADKSLQSEVEAPRAALESSIWEPNRDNGSHRTSDATEDTDHYVMAEDAEHSYNVSNGTQRVQIDMPDIMKCISRHSSI